MPDFAQPSKSKSLLESLSKRPEITQSTDTNTLPSQFTQNSFSSHNLTQFLSTVPSFLPFSLQHSIIITMSNSYTDSLERGQHNVLLSPTRSAASSRKRRSAASSSYSKGGCMLLASTALLALLSIPSSMPITHAFGTPLSQHHSSSTATRSGGSSIPTSSPFSIATPSTQSSSALSMSWAEVSQFYETYPIQSAVLTCGVKASIADGIAQFNAFTKSDEEQTLELKRNLAYVLYGGIFVGIMCHVEYNEVFPLIFGTTEPHVLEKVLLDNFFSAPFLWLPPAYLIKAMVYDYSAKEGMEKYWKDITQNGLLFRYWSIWLPAQTVSFSFVPDHMRVAFMAMISFFWFILFSSVASETKPTIPEATATATASITTTK
jgi:hypothetical protein